MTFAIVTAPQHGVIQDFDAAAGTFVYVPDVGYVGKDTIVFSATDSKLASAQGSVSIDVSAFHTAPVASDENVDAIATRPTTVTLQGYDAQIPVSELTLSIVSGPSHGTLSITGQDTVSYTAAAGYSGADSFSYIWIDGTVSPALDSAPATVSISVTSINQPPVTACDDDFGVREQGLRLQARRFPLFRSRQRACDRAERNPSRLAAGRLRAFSPTMASR